jgi:Zn-dependent protease
MSASGTKQKPVHARVECADHQRAAGHLNLLPLPPLDGGRIVVGVLPDVLARPLARLEPYGLMMLIGVLFILPLFGALLGIDLNIVWYLIQRSTNVIINAILWLIGNTMLRETAQYRNAETKTTTVGDHYR